MFGLSCEVQNSEGKQSPSWKRLDRATKQQSAFFNRLMSTYTMCNKKPCNKSDNSTWNIHCEQTTSPMFRGFDTKNAFISGLRPHWALAASNLRHGMRPEDRLCSMVDDLGGLKSFWQKKLHTMCSLSWKYVKNQHNEKSLWEGQPGNFKNNSVHEGILFCDFRKPFSQRSQVSISESLLVGKHSRMYRRPYNELVLLHELWKVSFALS